VKRDAYSTSYTGREFIEEINNCWLFRANVVSEDWIDRQINERERERGKVHLWTDA
jgi:hypothetical protein